MNYTTYFSRGQKVFLINITDDRDDSIFEAFSATITACDNHFFELRPRYGLNHSEEGLLRTGMQFKVTSESYGCGVQFKGTISKISGSNFSLVPAGLIEMYQRSQVPRMDLTLEFSTFMRTAPLSVFRHEWSRFVEGLSAKTAEQIGLVSSQINLGVGGVRYVADPADQQTDLSMAFIELEHGQPPVCAIAELLWRRKFPHDEGVAIGRRFVQIRKSDQDRIQNFILMRHKKSGRKIQQAKSNWELLDKMLHSE